MSQASIRELKHATSEVLSRVEAGEVVEVTRRNRVVAVLSPPKPEVPTKKPARPDFEKRLREFWGDRSFEITATELLSDDRQDR